MPCEYEKQCKNDKGLPDPIKTCPQRIETLGTGGASWLIMNGSERYWIRIHYCQELLSKSPLCPIAQALLSEAITNIKKANKKIYKETSFEKNFRDQE